VRLAVAGGRGEEHGRGVRATCVCAKKKGEVSVRRPLNGQLCRGSLNGQG